jgi:CrcB protein
VTGDEAILDSDVDLHDPVQRRELSGRGWRVLAVIAVGGVIGAEVRYGVGTLLPPGSRSFPWATVVVNITGGFAIGVLMALLRWIARPHPLVRPFFGVGILGGLTTFSTYSTDTYRLIDAGRPALALGYAMLTLVAALTATIAGGAAAARLSPRSAAELS